MSRRILLVAIESERDVVIARQRSRQIASALGFDPQDQTRIATAVSEVARNALRYACDGRVEFSLEGSTSPQVLFIQVTDGGPGIPHFEEVLRGAYRSTTGMGIGLLGSRKLMDGFEISSSREGTRVALKKLLPRAAPVVSDAGVADLARELARAQPRDVYEEVTRQNQELMRALDDLRQRQEELLRLNRELSDTNRGVLALYAELDEKADHLRRADELKTRFLSNMSHEFRTPLSSTLALTRLLLDRLDGPLTSEQERQVQLIRDGGEQLLELVNDLLDLAKVQAGKTAVRPVEFHARDLFGALRGMLRPLLVGGEVELAIEDPLDIPPLHTDEGKVSQILRNLIANALKFTERGEVRVSAEALDGDARVRFTVADTGIGIARDDQERIFEEFGQVDGPIQARVRGTGLGLPLSRRLAALLGGTLTVDSEPGRGSRFVLEVPREWSPPRPAREPAPEAKPASRRDPLRVPVLLIDDDAGQRVVYESFLRGTRFQALAARSLREARETLREVVPAAIVLDIDLGGEDSWQFLAEIEASDDLGRVPVLVATVVDDERKARALGAEGFERKPIERETLLAELSRLTGQGHARATRVLVVDDDPGLRYALRRDLERLGCAVDEADSGNEGLERVRASRPELVFLDLRMPFERGSGDAVLALLRADAATAGVPVVVMSSEEPEPALREEIERTAVFAPKASLSLERLSEFLEGRPGPRGAPEHAATMESESHAAI